MLVLCLEILCSCNVGNTLGIPQFVPIKIIYYLDIPCSCNVGNTLDSCGHQRLRRFVLF